MIEEPPDSQLQTPDSLQLEAILSLGRQIRDQATAQLSATWREQLELEAVQLSESLANPRDSLVERLLQEQVVTHSLDFNVNLIHEVEFQPYFYYQYNHRFHNRRLDRAHSRLAKAVRRLGRVQAMNLPRSE